MSHERVSGGERERGRERQLETARDLIDSQGCRSQGVQVLLEVK